MCRPDARSRISSKTGYHDIVCTEHAMTLRQVQKAIAKNWETLYKKVYGEAPHQKFSRAARSAREALTHGPGTSASPATCYGTRWPRRRRPGPNYKRTAPLKGS